MSFKLGLYVSFLAVHDAAAARPLLGCGGATTAPTTNTGEVRTVAKNSLVPMGLSLLNKAIDFAFAMLYVRLLGPEGTGKWYFVVAIYGFFEIISRYGLGTLLTRDVAEDKNRSSRYLTNVLALRTLLWLAVLPVLMAPGSATTSAHSRSTCWGYTSLAAARWTCNPSACRRCRRLRCWRLPCSLPTTPTPSAACSSPSRRWSIPPG